MERADCRFYQNILHHLTLKGVVMFIDTRHCRALKAPICALYRVQNQNRQTCFKSAASNAFLLACQTALTAKEYEKGFVQFLSPELGLAKIYIAQNNSLYTNLLDEKVETVYVDKLSMLPALMVTHLRNFHNFHRISNKKVIF